MSSPPVSFPRVFANEKGRVRRPHSSDELGVQFSTTIGVQVDITTAVFSLLEFHPVPVLA